MREQKKYSVSSVDRAINILRQMQVAGKELTLPQIASLTGLHKPSAFRILKTLSGEGFVFKDLESGTYRLAYRMIAISEAAKRAGGLVVESKSAMRRVHSEIGESVYLSIRDGDYRVDIDKIDGKNAQSRIIRPEAPKPLYMGAPSKVFASTLSDIELSQMLDRLAPVNFDRATFFKEIQAVQRHGYCVNKTAAGALSAPIYDRSKKIVATVSVSAPLNVYLEISETIKREVTGAAREITRNISRY